MIPYSRSEVTPDFFPRFKKLLKRPSRRKVISTTATVEFWLRHNAINTAGLVTKLPDRVTTDGSTVERTEWVHRQPGISIVLWKIIERGHTWPGGKHYLPARTIRPTNQDIDASETIWDFFSQHPKNGHQK